MCEKADIIFETQTWIKLLAIRRVQQLSNELFIGTELGKSFEDIEYIIKKSREIISNLSKLDNDKK
ncbi:MAG: hypothetical protein IJ890_05745 [Clostridia bacterium]|nr:hypothetical protein [Clostridia bacterium]